MTVRNAWLLLGLGTLLCLAAACGQPEATPTAAPTPFVPTPTAAPPRPTATTVPTAEPSAAEAYISAEDRAALRQFLRMFLVDPVTVWLFTVPTQSDEAEGFRAICQDMTTLSPLFHFEDRDLEADADWARRLGVNKGPAVVLACGVGEASAQGQCPGSTILRYFGMPEALQFQVVVESLTLLSQHIAPLEDGTLEGLADIKEPMLLEIFFNVT